MRALLIGVVVVACMALLEGAYFTIRYVFESRREELRRRLQSLGTREPGSVTLLRQGRLSRSLALDNILRLFGPSQRLEALIEQADLPLTVAGLLTYCGSGALAGLTIGMVARLGVPVALVLMVVLGFLPLLYVLNARDKRSRKISEQLPDALDMMARSLRAGHALSASFRLVASEMPEPINLEFGRAFEEQNLGLPFERTVENMSRRTANNRDLQIFVVSVIVQKETGGNLAEILEKIGETIRQRYRFYGKLRALTAEGRVSGYILGALPIVTGFLIYLMNPTYTSKLVTEPMGRAFLAYSIISWCIGFLWMRRVSQVEY